jgi:hypothetical protein
MEPNARTRCSTGMRTLAATVFAAFVVAAPASAAYPGTYALQNGVGLVHGSVQFDTSKLGFDTRLAALDAHTFETLRETRIHGAFGIPTLIPSNDKLGMFRDGTRFVLQSLANQSRTSFVVVRASDLQVLQRIDLSGSYAFDALAPNGSRLFLIQHTTQDFGHYVVRAYDLRAQKLLPGRIADKAQPGWVMHGWPVSRVETASGRWVYTLYTNPAGFPFVHALDTVEGVAHCVGIAWTGSQDELTSYRLQLAGNRLLVLRGSGVVYRSIDRTTWSVRLR